jgi:hypothetical protein
MIKLRDKETSKLAVMTGLDVASITTMIALGLLNQAEAINYLVLNDYRKLNNLNLYTRPQIIKVLSDEYDVDANKVLQSMRRNDKKVYYCNLCGRPVTYSRYKRNSGICNDCVSASISI